jgi:hypothetical protein
MMHINNTIRGIMALAAANRATTLGGKVPTFPVKRFGGDAGCPKAAT